MAGLKCLLGACAVAAVLAAAPSMAQTPPAPGASPRIDAIRKVGVLRVAVLANAPWLIENTTSGGQPWSGPAWLLAEEYAKRLGVKLKPVLVSHETKIPVLAANQVDISITPLAETPDRDPVVDFVLYSNTSVCMFGLANDPRFARAKTVGDLNRPDVTIAYFIGGAEEGWVKQRFPRRWRAASPDTSISCTCATWRRKPMVPSWRPSISAEMSIWLRWWRLC